MSKSLMAEKLLISQIEDLKKKIRVGVPLSDGDRKFGLYYELPYLFRYDKEDCLINYILFIYINKNNELKTIECDEVNFCRNRKIYATKDNILFREWTVEWEESANKYIIKYTDNKKEEIELLGFINIGFSQSVEDYFWEQKREARRIADNIRKSGGLIE